MTLLNKAARNDAAPALFRLLSDSAMSRAALGACGFPLAILDAALPARPLTYANPAFESFFGYSIGEAIGRPLGTLLFRGDEPLVHRLLAEAGARRSVKSWAKDGTLRPVDLSVGAVRAADGRVTHWVIGFADRSEIEQLKSELQALRSLAVIP